MYRLSLAAHSAHSAQNLRKRCRVQGPKAIVDLQGPEARLYWSEQLDAASNWMQGPRAKLLAELLSEFLAAVLTVRRAPSFVLRSRSSVSGPVFKKGGSWVLFMSFWVRSVFGG